MFRLTRPGAIVVAALLITAGSTFITSKDLPLSKPEDVGLSSERLARMNKSIHEYVDAGRTPGVVTLIARHGKVVHVDAYGKADLATGRPTRADDIFRMYSMTKPITSVALLMLYEEGKFQLTDPLSRYFPAFADVKVYAGSTPQGGMMLDALRRPITIQDVFRHSAGFSYGFGSSPIDKAYQDANVFATDLNGLMDKVAKQPLLYQPGDRWVYSVAHDVQAALVEKLSGQKFDDFVRQRIFGPLDMKESMFKVPADKKSRVPALYSMGRDRKLAVDTSPLGQQLRRSGVRRLQHLDDHRRLRALRADAAEQGAVERRAPAQPEDRGADGHEPFDGRCDDSGRSGPWHRLRARRVSADEPGRARQRRVGRRVRMVGRRVHARAHRSEGRPGRDLLHTADGR